MKSKEIGPRGGGFPSAPPLVSAGPNSFNFMQFLGKFGKIVCWRPPPRELVPPPRGNPSSFTFILKFTQESIHYTRMHSSRMHTTRSSSCLGGLHQAPPRAGTPLDQAIPGIWYPPGPDPLQTRNPPGPGTPLSRTRHPPVNRITDTCKNITFPQLRLRAVKMTNKSESQVHN